jgi:hypothetical protein
LDLLTFFDFVLALIADTKLLSEKSTLNKNDWLTSAVYYLVALEWLAQNKQGIPLARNAPSE